MTDYKKRLGTAIATVAILANGFAPVAFAGTTIEISGNGAGSDNWANVSQNTTTVVNQTNNANVNNNVTSNASTGGNNANFNTGGNTTISTGNATTNTTVTNVLNSNQAEVNCCQSGNTTVNISGNGAYSDNGVQLNQGTVTAVNQSNNANVNNNVDANAKTGGNDAYKNTGGDVSIVTGNAKSNVSVSTVANVNSARVSSNHGGSNPSASFIISGNGAGSDNYITADLAKTTTVGQSNNANVSNDVDADAKTGGNDANFNTGGDVMIDTGNATVNADVDNSVNFNFADVDCGCVWDVTAKISGNGADASSHHYKHHNHADNIITLNLDSVQAVGQGNNAGLNNDLGDLDAKTGYNGADSNTGTPETDPSIVTGDATVNSGVSNSGNVNVVGDMPTWEWPTMPEVDFSFNFAAMMAFFGMSF